MVYGNEIRSSTSASFLSTALPVFFVPEFSIIRERLSAVADALLQNGRLNEQELASRIDEIASALVRGAEWRSGELPPPAPSVAIRWRALTPTGATGGNEMLDKAFASADFLSTFSKAHCTAIASVRELLRALDNWNMKRSLAPRTSPSRTSPPPFLPSPPAERSQPSPGQATSFSDRLANLQERRLRAERDLGPEPDATTHSSAREAFERNMTGNSVPLPSAQHQRASEWTQGSNTLLTQFAAQTKKKERDQSARPKSPAQRSTSRPTSPGWLRQGQDSSFRLDRACTASPTSSSRPTSPSTHNSPLARCIQLAAFAHALPSERPRGSLSHWGSAPRNVEAVPQRTTLPNSGGVRNASAVNVALDMHGSSQQRSRGTFSARFSAPASGGSRVSCASEALDRLLTITDV